MKLAQYFINQLGFGIFEQPTFLHTTVKKREHRAKDTFISVVSHETQTPLAIIQESLGLILDEITGPLNDKQKSLLLAAHSNVSRLSHLLSDMLDWANIQTHNMTLQLDDLNVITVLKQAVNNYQHIAKKKEISLDYKKPSEGSSYIISGDNIKLLQVFENILRNAITYTEPNGKITVDIEEHPWYFRIAIEDTGAGISPDNLKHVFEPMQQFNRTYRSGSQGTGLGLAICKGLLELHGGNIHVESVLEKGTTVIVELPKPIVVS